MASKEWPEIRAGLLKHARRLNEPNHTPSKIELQCALFVAERLWPEPRGAPVQINNANHVDVVAALARGELTPPDAATLLRTLSAAAGAGREAMEPGQAVALLQERIRRVLVERDRQQALEAAQTAAAPAAIEPGAPEDELEALEREIAELEAEVDGDDDETGE
jgi:hypothetical protein